MWLLLVGEVQQSQVAGGLSEAAWTAVCGLPLWQGFIEQLEQISVIAGVCSPFAAKVEVPNAGC